MEWKLEKRWNRRINYFDVTYMAKSCETRGLKMTPPMVVTEDTPADMLTGCMDLNVVLPGGKTVWMSVLRSTPMMDLLVQVTTAHRLSPGNYSLQAVGAPGILPYKPSTPIGTLDAFMVKIVQKKSFTTKKAPQAPSQNFLSTFRLQIHLPRSQLFVMRVSPEINLSYIFDKVCLEKSLDPHKYELRNTGNINEILDLTQTLAYYHIEELSLLPKGIPPVFSSADILHVKHNGTCNNKQDLSESSVSSGSLESRSISPVAMTTTLRQPPQVPTRKKRKPAPPPPIPNGDIEIRPVRISHSRESSDSSGYHEASTLSESPIHNGPPPINESSLHRDSRNASRSMGNLSRLPSSTSVTSLNSNGPKKKKAAPPPPQMPVKSATLPSDVRRKSETLSCREELVETPEPVETELPVTPGIEIGKVAPQPMPRKALIKPEIKEKPKILRTTRSADDFKMNEPVIVRRTTAPELDVDLGEEKHDDFNSAFDGETLSSSYPQPTITASCTQKSLPKTLPRTNKNKAEHDTIKSSLITSWSPDYWLVTNLQTDCKTVKEDTITKTTEQLIVEQHDSLDIDWEYQLPPPPTHFRDPVESPSEVIAHLDNTIREIDSIDFNTPSTVTNGHMHIYNDIETYHIKKSDDSQILLKNKSKVMNELTNVLKNNQERSKSYNNLYMTDGELKKGLSHSNSFATAPIRNFQMGSFVMEKNYKNLSTSVEDVSEEFKKPHSPKKVKHVRRADSVCVAKRKQLDSEMLKEQFLQFLQEKNLLDRETEINSSEIINDILPIIKDEEEPDERTKEISAEQSLQISQTEEPVVVTESKDALKITPKKSEERPKESKIVQNIPIKAELDPKNPDEVTDTKAEVIEVQLLNQTEVTSKRPVMGDAQLEGVKDITKTSEVIDSRSETTKVVVKKPEVTEIKSNTPEWVLKKSGTTEVAIDTEMAEKTALKPKAVEMAPKISEKDSEHLKPKKSMYIYPKAPAISLGTWGERPKSQVLIKDADYTTHENVEKLKEKKVVQNTAAEVEIKKPATFLTKKPTNYELFSALPKKKEESSRVPVVCGVELKKEFKANNYENVIPKKGFAPVVKGFRERESIPEQPVVKNLRERESIPEQPVVKGFRERESIPEQPVVKNLRERESIPEQPVVKGFRERESIPEQPVVKNLRERESIPERPVVKGFRERGSIPEPPVFLNDKKNLKPVVKPKTDVQPVDSRELLLEQIRNFGGQSRLRKTAQ